MQSQRNSVPRRFGFGFAPTASNSASTSNHNTSSSSSTSNAVDTTPDSNRRHSTGKPAINAQSPVKGSPSPNRNSLKMSKGEPATPTSVSSPVTKPATTSVQSPPSTTELSNSSVVSIGGSSSAGSTFSVEQSLIKVCVRVRPLLNEEITESVVWQWKENSITPIPWHQRNQGGSNGAMEYSMANPNATFTFDHLFTPDHTNTHIFQDVIKEIVTSGMNGYHGSVFTYGQTSSGKTFTMYGAPSQQGVITQAIEYCFDAINTFPEREFLLRVSYLEVYNEQVKDLLSTESIPIKILYDPKVGTVLSGVKEHVVFNPQQVYQLIKQGESHRHIGVTDMNAQSSRAHTLFKIIIESKERNSLKASPVRVSTLNLVDLAGSENAKMTNSTGERAREAKHINQSLLTLSTIIQRLSEEHAHHRKSSAQHLPYRDSKLTRLLESALDGNARIAIICNISPTSRCMEESVNTLKFGARAKLIRLSAKVNENVDDKTLLRAYREEIEQLKLRLKELEEKQSLPAPVAPVSSTMMTPPLQRSRDRSQSNDDNQSIEVTSATKIDIHETIHQIEDKLMQTSHIAKEDDEQQKMLQMIEAMERLILKADNSSKQKIRRNLGAPSSETVDPSERLIRSKSFKSGDNDQGNEGKELESKKSFKKLPSFATGIPINTSHRSNIPRRGANQNPSTSLSRSNSSVSIDNSGSIAVDKVGSNESDLFATKSKVFSPKGLPKKKSFNVPAQSSPKQPQQQSMFLSHSNSSRDVGDDGGAPISSKSFEEAILRSEGNRQNDEERETGDNEGEEDDGEHKFSPLTRQPSIPLSDLQQNYNKLEVNAGKVGLMPTLHLASHHWNTYAYSMPPPVPASDKDHPGTAIDRTASISPLTVGTEPSASVLPQQAPTRGQRSLPPLDTNVSNIGGFAFSPSTTVNHGNLPPHQPQSSPYETHFLSTSIPTGGTTPMKNRILRKVKYSDDDFVATPGVVGVASISGDTPLPDDNSATALEKMRQFAMSNDTLDSLNNSIDARFVAPNDVLVEDDSVLLGVSKMLMMLKDYISKAKQQERPQPLISNESNSSNKPSVSIGIAAVSDNNSVSGKESIQSKNSEQSQAGNNNNSTTKTTNNTSNSDNKPLPAPSAPVVPGNASHGGNQRKRELGPNEIAVCRDEYEKLKQDFALKEADNHFLQEELEQKDKMLGMLTEGLKEVQESQLQWLTANQDLSQELEKTLLMNQILRNEITRLNNLLLSQQSQVTSTEKDEEGNSSLQRKSPLPPTTTTTFVSEEVTQLLLSPSRAVSTNQNLYLTRSRSVSQSRSPMRSYQSQGQLPQISSPPPLLQSDVGTPFVDREKTPPSSPTPKQDVEAKIETNIPETPLVELVRSPSPVSPLPLTDNQEIQKEESQKTDDASIVIPLSAPVIMSPLPNIAASPPKSPKPSSIPAEGLLTPEPSNSVFVSPMSVSSTATTTIASPDSNVWTALNPSQVHIPSSANNVLDWKQLPMDFTNIHNEAELTEYFGENEEKEKKNGELKVENSVGTPLQTPLGEQIISPGELSNLTNSHCSLDHEDASVIVHVERIYHSCDSMESFGSIKESW